MSRTSALGQFTLLPVLADAADITAVGTTMADRIEKYVNMRFASTAARDAAITVPEEGMHVYVGSNDSAEGYYSYNGTSWRPLSWNAPWGVIGTAAISSDQTGIAAEADVTGFTITFTAVANRAYQFAFLLEAQQLTAGAATQVFRLSLDGTVGTVNAVSPMAIGQVQSLSVSKIATLTAGSRICKLRASTSAGTMSIINSITAGQFSIVDIGPTGAPS